MPKMRISILNLIYDFICVIALFLYFFPIELNAFPIPLNRICQVLGLIVMIFRFKWKISPEIFKVFLVSLSILVVGLLLVCEVNVSNDLSFVIIRGPYLMLYVFHSYLIVWAFSKSKQRNYSFIMLLKLCVYVSLIYALISVLFFINPDLLSWYKELIVLNDSISDKVDEISVFRLFGASPNMSYANASVHMGVCMWIVILLYKERVFPFCSKNIFGVFVAFFSVIGILFGRTYFVILVMTIVYLLRCNNFSFRSSFRDIINVFIPILVIGFIFMFYLISTNEEAVSWAFELFINYFNKGSLSSESTDSLYNMFILPNNLRTWFVGDGIAFDSIGSFYMNSDVGYIRSVFYWGIIGSLVYYYGVIYIYKVSKNRIISYPNISALYFMIIMWFMIYNLKEFWSAAPFLILFLVASIYLPIKNNFYYNIK